MPNETPSSSPTPKVLWGTLAGAFGGAITTLVLGLLKREGTSLDAEEAAALTIVIQTIVTFLGGYITPPKGFQGNFPTPLVLAFVLGGSLLLQSCSYLGLPNPVQDAAPVDTPRKQLLTLEYSYAGAINTMNQLVNTGALKGDALVKTDDARKKASVAIQAAEQAVKSGQPANTLTLANSALTSLLLILEEEQAKNGSTSRPSSFDWPSDRGWRSVQRSTAYRGGLAPSPI